MGKPEFMINTNTGEKILNWCNDGMNVDTVRSTIQNATTVEELGEIYHQYPEWYPLLTADFMQKKAKLQEESEQHRKPIINFNFNSNQSKNGSNNAITAG